MFEVVAPQAAKVTASETPATVEEIPRIQCINVVSVARRFLTIA